MLVLALQFSTSGWGRAPPTNDGHRPRATAPAALRARCRAAQGTRTLRP